MVNPTSAHEDFYGAEPDEELTTCDRCGNDYDFDDTDWFIADDNRWICGNCIDNASANEFADMMGYNDAYALSVKLSELEALEKTLKAAKQQNKNNACPQA